ncbi:hypothetical protein MAPG_06175 [Magnaporthiopsis poae ATCC 64411]|uniref:DUF6594 domain-containing protein n=1 Tax=Magnaporthiopsis poae (strain ATCC 64411 / 73-15) TaxID=644358 RepID=A0A0C4E1B7_MAGP6|nr:hypothetical protein MAPG_06175 [Magnaporthiopsis poae ATCC 64411]
MWHYRRDLMGLRRAEAKPRQLNLLGYSLSLQRGAKANCTQPSAHIEVSFAALNRMRMRKLQMLLVQRILHMRYHNEMPEDWEYLLRKYVEAARDGDYIRSCVDRGENGIDDPFIVTSRRVVDRQVLKNELRFLPSDLFPPNSSNDEISWLELGDEDDDDKNNGNNKTQPNSANGPRGLAKAEETYAQPIGGLRPERSQAQQWREFLSRFAFAVVGGAFLIVPMWIMVKLKDKHRDLPLIFTTLSVFICGVATARMLDRPEVVLSITAAYAAVLVVFVGTSDATGGS